MSIKTNKKNLWKTVKTSIKNDKPVRWGLIVFGVMIVVGVLQYCNFL